MVIRLLQSGLRIVFAVNYVNSGALIWLLK